MGGTPKPYQALDPRHAHSVILGQTMVRTSHNGNSRKFVQSFTGVLCTAENGCQNPEQRWSQPPEGAFQTGVVRAPATSQRSRWQGNLATTLVGCLLKRNRCYELLHIKLLRCVLILCIIDITLHTREASTFSICCLRLSFCCLRCCVLRLKTRSLRPRSRSFRSSTVIRCSRSSACLSRSCIS